MLVRRTRRNQTDSSQLAPPATQAQGDVRARFSPKFSNPASDKTYRGKQNLRQKPAPLTVSSRFRGDVTRHDEGPAAMMSRAERQSHRSPIHSHGGRIAFGC